MISKIVKFITKKKKTISERSIIETIDMLKLICENNVGRLDNDIFTKSEEIVGKLIYLRDINYEDKDLNILNGIFVELIEKQMGAGKTLIKSYKTLYEALTNYNKYVDKILLKYK